jgi:hypothetical protein
MFFDQSDKDFEGAAPEPHWCIAFQQEPLRRKQSKGAKENRSRRSISVGAS